MSEILRYRNNFIHTVLKNVLFLQEIYKPLQQTDKRRKKCYALLPFVTPSAVLNLKQALMENCLVHSGSTP